MIKLGLGPDMAVVVGAVVAEVPLEPSVDRPGQMLQALVGGRGGPAGGLEGLAEPLALVPPRLLARAQQRAREASPGALEPQSS